MSIFLDKQDANLFRGTQSVTGIEADFNDQMNSIVASSGNLPASSDSLTNPLGTGNLPQQSAPVSNTPAPDASVDYNWSQTPPTPTSPVIAPLTDVPSSAPSNTQTTAGLSGGGPSDTRDPRGLLGKSATYASWLGQDGTRALQSVLVTEGGMSGARGDNGKSAGPLQFYEGGQLANFAQQHGLSLDSAKTFIEQNPEQAIQWAIGTADHPGYLGAAIQAGQSKGLTGADLATYAQQHGQVSVSPERAGSNWNTMFATGGSGVPPTTPIRDNQSADYSGRTSQFKLGYTDADAYSACGPAAAIAFAQRYGRSPSPSEALELAKSVGWSQNQGMAGVQSEQRLLEKMGVATKLENGINWTHVQQDANSGNPVIIDTPGHYFFVDGYNAQNGTYHVGTSGSDLKGGSEWMTPDQMSARMGATRAALYADNPTSPAPSVASSGSVVSQDGQSPASSEGAKKGLSLDSIWGDFSKGMQAAVSGAGQAKDSTLDQLHQAVTDHISSAGSSLPDITGALNPSNVQSAAGNAVNSVINGQDGALDRFAQNGPIGLARDGLQGAMNSGVADFLGISPAAVQQRGDDDQRAQQLIQQTSNALTASGVSQGKALAEALAGDGMAPDDAAWYANYEAQQARTVGMVEGEAGAAGDALKRPLFGRGGVPGGTGKAPEIPAAAGDTKDLLQQMIDSLRGKGNDAKLGELQSQLDTMRSPDPAPAPTTPIGVQIENALKGGADTPTLQSIQDLIGSHIQTREIPGGVQPGQLGFESELPAGGARPTGNESIGPANTRGQMPLDGFGQELPTGGAAPGGIERQGRANTPGQLPMDGFGQELPTGGPRPTGRETQGPSGALPGQMQLGGDFPKGTAPVSAGELFNAYHSGNVISGAGTATHVAVNSIVAPVWSAVTRTGADLATLRFDRIGGRSVGVASALRNVGSDFMDALAEHYSNPQNIANRVDNGLVKRGLQAQQMVGAALHSTLQNVASGAVTRMEYGAMAGERAAKEGLQGRDFAARVAELINDPSQLADAAHARDIGQRAALRAPAGSLQRTMQGIAKFPVLGNTLFPVVRIAAQSIAQGVEKSPIGLVGTGFDVARGLAKSGPYANGFNVVGKAVTPLGDRLTNNLAGTALTAFMAQKAMDGTVTGDGPSDPSQRAILAGQGWQPHSVYVPGRGYVDYHLLGPLAVPLALAGSYADAQLYSKGDATDKAFSMTSSFGSYFEDATGLRTLGDLAAVLKGGQGFEATASTFLGHVAGGFVPESGLVRSIAQATDSTAKQPNLKAEPGESNAQQIARGSAEIIKQSIPGLRADVPNSLDVLGRTQENPAAGFGALVPNTGKGAPSVALKTYGDLGMTIPAAPTSISVKGTAVPLGVADRQVYEQARGAELDTLVTALSSMSAFKQMSVARQQAALRILTAKADQAASKVVLAQLVKNGVFIDRFVGGQSAAQDRHAPLPAVAGS